jgi:hypothetical protein
MSLWDRLVERLDLPVRYAIQQAISREREDGRSKLTLLIAVFAVVVVPSSFLFTAGFPGWLVWPYFGLAFGVVSILWLAARYYGLYLSKHPDLFWPHLPDPPKKAPEGRERHTRSRGCGVKGPIVGVALDQRAAGPS